MGYVAVASQSGASVLDGGPPTTASDFYSSPEAFSAAERAVEAAGLHVVATSRLGLAVYGDPRAFHELTGKKVYRTGRYRRAEAGRRREVTHLDFVGGAALGVTAGEGEVDAVILEQPRVALDWSASPVPPPVARYHLRVPDDVAVLLRAVDAHRRGHTGTGISVAMVDTGHAEHPFFGAHGYTISEPKAVVPGTDPRFDPVGHGTGESANLFAVAPGITLQPYRASDEGGRLVGAVAGFMQAKADRPRIITNSWGGDGPLPPTIALPPLARHRVSASRKLVMAPYSKAFAAEIRDAVEEKIVVVFAAGNGTFSVEPQVPGVLSAGGVFRSENGSYAASDYTSAYASSFYPRRTIPDLCGLVGQGPRGQYLMLPVPPGCPIDLEEATARGDDPGDGTAADDGWALFSGTSAAAPQLAGAAALILEAKAKELGLTEKDLNGPERPQILEPAQVVDALVSTADDVRSGSCHPRFNAYARGGWDVATGAGLLNVSAAVDYALKL
jgi:subtilisin family serine protease